MRGPLSAALLAAALAAAGIGLLVWRSIPATPAPPVLAELPGFRLLERRGGEVGRAELAGRPFVADFVFTRCRVFCPRLTARMKELGGRLGDARRVSITVDPEHDTPAELTAYARSWGIESEADWLFLTGDREEVRALVRQGFLLPVEDAPDNEAMPILHSNRFALVDRAGRLRGTYEAFEAAAVERLLADLAALAAEEG
jgi:protein SCO1/2